MTWLNLLIIAFIAGMAYWWALQGFFSSLLHLVLVIVSGSVALSFWEILVIHFLGHRMPAYAWGVGLLGIFVLLLILLRLAVDKLVAKNVNFQNLVSNAGGAVLGILSAILTAGLTIIGIGFLPLSSSLVGYEPFLVAANGRLEPYKSLWLPVDRIAYRFFAGLSAGSFRTESPLAVYQPDLPTQAALFRMRYDPHSSLGAIPGSIELTKVYQHATPVPDLDPQVATLLGEPFSQSTNKIIAIDTTWHENQGTYDRDGVLRVPPMQVRLVAEREEPHGIEFFAPIAFSQEEDPLTKQRSFHAINTAEVSAYGAERAEKLTWIFIIPADRRPLFLFARHQRLILPEEAAYVGNAQETIAALGELRISGEEDSLEVASRSFGRSQAGERVGPRSDHYAHDLEFTNQLPTRFSKNFAQGLKYQPSQKGFTILSGMGIASIKRSGVGKRVVVNSIHVPSTLKGMVRLRLATDRAQSLFGKSLQAAASLGGVWLVDDRQQIHQPIAFVLHKKAANEMFISVDHNKPLRSARELRVAEMRGDDELYLYFTIRKGRKIIRYEFSGGKTVQEIEPPLEVR